MRKKIKIYIYVYMHVNTSTYVIDVKFTWQH